MSWSKHVIECHCILPQYRERPVPVYHKFVVFSAIDESDTVIPSYAQCNNCGTVHKIYDICKSEIVAGKDESAVSEKMSDVKISLPKQLNELFENYSLDISDYQLARHILENKLWKETIVLSKESEEGLTTGKILKILGPEKFRVESFSRQEIIE
tara:strand:- start:1423 stop:1887 length:465 start_codon:yes stop_codon:yes gene_type:complete